MGSRGQHVREVVQHESGLVGEDAGLLRPEPDGDEVLLLARGEVLETVDASPDAENLCAAQVFDEQLRGVTSIFRLLGGEVALLPKSDAIEAVPVRPDGTGHAHAQTSTAGLDSRKQLNIEPTVWPSRPTPQLPRLILGGRCRIRTCDPCRVKAVLYR
jgi:hypothetical protein